MSNQALNVAWSWLRVFLAAFLTATLVDIADGGLDSINWKAILIAGIVAVGPVIVNWLNAGDPRYGRGYVTPEG
jgi:hypothetical protein